MTGHLDRLESEAAALRKRVAALEEKNDVLLHQLFDCLQALIRSVRERRS